MALGLPWSLRYSAGICCWVRVSLFYCSLDSTLTRGGSNPEEVLFPKWASLPVCLQLLQAPPALNREYRLHKPQSTHLVIVLRTLSW